MLMQFKKGKKGIISVKHGIISHHIVIPFNPKQDTEEQLQAASQIYGTPVQLIQILSDPVEVRQADLGPD